MAVQPKRRNIDKIENTIERRAALIVDMMYDQAERMVNAMDEPPPGMKEPDPATVRLMWDFTSFANPDKAFWELHDVTLAPLIQQVAQQPLSGDERLKAMRSAHQQAELTALQKVYPQRAKLTLLGVTTLARSVQLADRAARLSAQQQDKRQPEQPAITEGAAY